MQTATQPEMPSAPQRVDTRPTNGATHAAPGRPKSRRPTGASLVRRLLSSEDLAYRLKDTDLVPHGGEQVLKVVARLIASSPTGELFPVHYRFAPGGLARKVVLKLGLVGSKAEEQIDTHLSALMDAELLVRTDEGYSLPLPPLPEEPELSAADASSAETMPGSDITYMHPVPGRGPTGLSPEGYQQRIAMRRDVVELQNRYRDLIKQQDAEVTAAKAAQQRSMLLAVPGGKAEAGDTRAEIGTEIAREAGDIAREIDAAEQPKSPDISAASHVGLADAESGKSESQPATSASRARDGRPGISAAEMPDISPEHMSAAKSLAADLISKFGFRAEKTLGIVREVAMWFHGGITRDQMDPAIERALTVHRRDRQQGKPGVASVNYLSKIFLEGMPNYREAHRLQDIQASAPPVAPATPFIDPRIAGVEAWRAADVETRCGLAFMVDLLDGPPKRDRPSRLRSLQNRYGKAYKLLIAERPDAEEAFEEQDADFLPPGRAAAEPHGHQAYGG